MRRVLIWLSGANPQILARCPTDQAKYVGIGSAVLTTSLMAAASCAFALHMGLRLSVASCLLVGGAWGLAIMGLDRWLVSSVQRRDRWYQNLVIAFPRLALAVLIGLVISTPLVLRIFEPEIQAELVNIHRERADQFDRAMQNDERARQINDLRARQAQLQATVASGGVVTDVSKDPEVARLQPQVDAARTKYNDAEEAVVCEKEGRPGCGSGKAGAGIAYNEKVVIRDNAKADLDNLQRQLDAAVSAAKANQSASRASTLANAQSELGTVTTQLDSLEKARAADTTAFNAENTDDTGMLIRIEALDRLTAKRPALARAHLLLLLFITSIECLPILVKFLMSLGPPTLYERAVEIEERNRLLTEEELGRRRRATELLDSEDAYLEAQVGREAKDAAIEQLTRRTIQTQTEIAEAVLATWRERELRRIQSDLNSYLVAGPQPSPDTRLRDVAPPFPYRNDLPSQSTRVHQPAEERRSDGWTDTSSSDTARAARHTRPMDEPFPVDTAFPVDRTFPVEVTEPAQRRTQVQAMAMPAPDGRSRYERDNHLTADIEDEPTFFVPSSASSVGPMDEAEPTPLDPTSFDPTEPGSAQPEWSAWSEESESPTHTRWWSEGPARGEQVRMEHPPSEDVTEPVEATQGLATEDGSRHAQADPRPRDLDDEGRDTARQYHANRADTRPGDLDDEPTWVPRTDGRFGPRADSTRPNGRPTDSPDREDPAGWEWPT